MTFRLLSVEVKDFKCYYGEHGFEFPQERGLYYLTGRNLFNKRLGANAVGKTSLIDAIEWCIYGKTSRGLRAGDVVSWGKKSCSVTLTLVVGDQEVEITRTQSPNSIAINDKASSQEDVTKLIRLNQEAFACSVILPQFGVSFFDLTATQKLAMFSEVMELDYWMNKSDLAKEKAGVTYAGIIRIEQEISKLEGRIENTRADLKELKAKDVEYHAVVKREKARLISERDGSLNRVNEYEGKAKKFTKAASKVDKALSDVDDAIQEVGADFTTMGDHIQTLVAQIRANNRRVDEYNVEMRELSSMVGETCSACKQLVGEGHVDSHQSKIAKKLANLIKDTTALDAERNDLAKKYEALRADINDLGKLKRELEAERNEALDKARSINRLVENNKDEVARYDIELDKLAVQKNPYEDMITTRRKSLKQYKQDMITLETDLAEQKAKHEAISYWVGGFKRVRLFVIEEALTALEVEVNNLLVSLGMVDWKITLDVERENKSGGITKGFSVFIHSPKHSEPVKWENFSGGETQRLRLAGNLGLANLIMEQAGFENYIEIVDEPSEHMSPEGIEDMIETLHERAHSTDKQIWLVDHSTMDFGAFSGVLMSVMDKKGRARLEYKT